MIFEKSKRQFVKFSGIALAGFFLPLKWSGNDLKKSNRYDGLKTRKYLGKVRIETRIVDSQTFTEGPAVDRSGHVYFTNIPVEKILKWNPEAKTLSTFISQSYKANGLRFSMNGDLLICESGAGKITKHNIKTGEQITLAQYLSGKGYSGTQRYRYRPQWSDLFYITN
ncbi:MAG: hypothetical protein IPL46_19225 [Saprospiraceae bacterium]|nr:hypothetical protein [Saprospiraceae bacterium]